MNLLKTKEPKAVYDAIYKYNEMIHGIRMKEKIDNDFDELPEDIFRQTVEKLISKPGNKYDFLLKGGKGLRMALLNLYKIVWREE